MSHVAKKLYLNIHDIILDIILGFVRTLNTYSIYNTWYNAWYNTWYNTWYNQYKELIYK